MTTFPQSVSLPLSIVLASYMRPDPLMQCLHDLTAQVTDKEFEVILVLQGYPDAFPAQIDARFGQRLRVVYLCFEQGLGLITARNIGLRSSRGDIIAFLDDDILLPTDWVGQILRRYEDPAVGGVAGYVKHGPGLREHGWWLYRLLGLDPPAYRIDRFGFVSHPLRNFADYDQETMWLPGTASSYRRAVFENVDFFEERFGYGFEDSDLGVRVRRAGWRLILTPAATITHDPSPTNRLSRVGSAYHMEKVRVLAVRKALAERKGWRAYYCMGFLRQWLIWCLSGIANRDGRLPLAALKGAWAGMLKFGQSEGGATRS